MLTSQKGAVVILLLLFAAAVLGASNKPSLTAPVPNDYPANEPGVWYRAKFYFGVYGSEDYKWGWAREDMETDAWSTWGTLPTAMMDHMVAATPTHQYVMGGYGGTQLTGIYRNDMVSRTWTTLTAMPFGLCNSDADWWGDTIYVFGGYSYSNSQCMDTVAKYSITGNNWVYAPGPEPGGGSGNGFGWQPSTVTDLTNGHIYRIGGCQAPGATNPTANFWRYIPGSGWTQRASPSHGRVFSHVWFFRDTIWVATGFGNGNQVVTRVCEAYSVANNTWSDAAFPDIPAGVDNGVWAGGQGSTPYNTGIGVIYSGANASFAIVTRDHIYNHETGTWSTPNTTLPITRYRGATIGNWFQQCLMTGGASSGFAYTNTVVFDSWPGLIYPNDVGVARFVVPASPMLVPGSTIQPTITVKNFGTNAQVDFPVGFHIVSGTDTVFAETTLVSLLAGDSVDVVFSDWNVPDSLFLSFTMWGYTMLSGDQRTANDRKTIICLTTTDTIFSHNGAPTPNIDGYLAPNEWDHAFRMDATNAGGRGSGSPAGPSYFYFMHNAYYMYIACAMPNAPQRNVGDQCGFYIDEDNDGSWETTPVEGNYWFVVNASNADEVQYRPWTTSGPGQPATVPGAICASSVFNGYLVFEGRIPVGDLPYQLTVDPATDTCGMFLFALDAPNTFPGWWPVWLDDTLGWQDPSLYGKMILKTLQSGDVGVASIEAPVGRVPPGGTVTPRATWRNYGTTPMNFTAYCFINDPSGTRIYTQSQASQLNGGQTVQLTFPTSGALTTEGGYTVKCSTAAAGDQNPANDWREGAFAVGLAADMAVVSIIAPTGVVETMAVIPPQARIKVNYAQGAVNAAIYFIIKSPDDTVRYNELINWTGATVGEDSVFTFPDFGPVPNIAGRWSVLCSLYCAPDTFAANDKKTGVFFVGQGPGVVYAFKGNKTNEFWLYNQDVPSWTEKASATVGSKPIAAGGFLTYNAGDQRIYAGKGNKTNDFLRYSIMGDSWALLKPIPGTKPANKGTVGRADGEGNVYVVLGNNTFEFYRYNADADSWKKLNDVPGGASGKKVKAGSNLAWAPGEPGRLYFLKGGKNDFMAYRPDGDSWAQLANAPGDKYPAGSWLAFDGDSLVYCHQGKVGAMNIFNTKTGAWSAAPGGGIPLTGRSGKSKKPKDGSAGAFLEGKLYALKGGNTEELWVYAADSGKWTQLDDVPLIGSTGKKKKVKAGGDLTIGAPPVVMLASKAGQYGVTTQEIVPGKATMTIAPNPLANGFATVQFSLPRAGEAHVRVTDVTGRTVIARTLAATRTGAVGLDLRQLAAGVYLVRLEADGYSTQQKLVVQH